MIKTSVFSAAITTAFLISTSALAQPTQEQTATVTGETVKQHSMPYSHFSPPVPPKRMPMPKFPTPEQLAKMAPPEPMTEAKIKERFAKRKASMAEAMERDRKAAEKYAQDFARLQKHQADSLAELMARAEKRREAILKRIDDMEQKVLQRFNEKNTAKGETAADSK